MGAAATIQLLLAVTTATVVATMIATTASTTTPACPRPAADPTWHTPGLPNTTCVPFCEGECALPGPIPALMGQRQNVTMTRLTPREIDTPGDKDFGDLAGDFEFAIMQKSMAQRCLENPDDYICYNGTGKFLKPGTVVWVRRTIAPER